MTPQEAVVLARYVRALCPQQKFDELTPDAWHTVLAPYDLADAQAAVHAHVTAGNVFIAVGEIITGIRDIRAERIAQANLVYDGQPGETGAESATRIRALTDAAAAGHLPAQPIRAALESRQPAEEPTGRARAVLTAVGNSVPTRRDGVINILSVPCPVCLARPGRTCTSPRNPKRHRPDAHPARLEDARRAAAGLPPADRSEAEREIQRRREAAAAALAALPVGTVIEPDDGFIPDARQEDAS